MLSVRLAWWRILEGAVWPKEGERTIVYANSTSSTVSSCQVGVSWRTIGVVETEMMGVKVVCVVDVVLCIAYQPIQIERGI